MNSESQIKRQCGFQLTMGIMAESAACCIAVENHGSIGRKWSHRSKGNDLRAFRETEIGGRSIDSIRIAIPQVK